MSKTSQREKKRVAQCLNSAGLTREHFRLSDEVRQEISRRDRVEKEARKAKIRVG